jgi:hypothetical protein
MPITTSSGIQMTRTLSSMKARVRITLIEHPIMMNPIPGLICRTCNQSQTQTPNGFLTIWIPSGSGMTIMIILIVLSISNSHILMILRSSYPVSRSTRTMPILPNGESFSRLCEIHARVIWNASFVDFQPRHYHGRNQLYLHLTEPRGQVAAHRSYKVWQEPFPGWQNARV